MASADTSGDIHRNQHGCIKRSGKKHRPEADDIRGSAMQDRMEKNVSGRTQRVTGEEAEKQRLFRDT